MDVAALLRIAGACELGVPLDHGDRVALAGAIRAWATGSHPSLDAAMGVKRGCGQKSHTTAARLATRDALLRACADRFFASLCLSARTEAISTALCRYEASGWRIDRGRSSMPPDYEGTEREYLYRICALGTGIPKRRRLIEILGVVQ
jgi:hypothetical protein